MMLGKNKGSDETAKRIPVGSVGVEIGVWKGESTAKFLANAEHIHLVDPWSVGDQADADFLAKYSKIVGSTNPRDFQKYYDDVYRSVADRFNRVTIHRCESSRFFSYFNEKVDWVYIDGLHTYEGCLADLRGALEILKPTGVIYGDDFGNKPGVTQAVKAFGMSYTIFGVNQYEIFKCPI